MTNLLERWLSRSARRRRHPRPGDYLSVRYRDKGLRIAKVLAVDDYGVHLRIFANAPVERPEKVDPGSLQLGFFPVETLGHEGMGSIADSLTRGAFPGVGHLPVSWVTFLQMEAEFIQAGEVSEEELEGYREWENASGGYW